MWLRKYRLMQEAGAEGGGGGGGDTGAGGSDANDGAPAAPGEEQAPGAAGEQGTKPAGSLLKTGEAGQDVPPAPSEFIPEKYRVTNDDGSLDFEASARKLAEAHGHLEKRLGAGDVPPKEVADYQFQVPESMGEYKPTEDPGMQAFLADAHKVGLTQAQLDTVMQHYFQVAPTLAGAAQEIGREQATEALQKVWGSDEREFQRNAGLAHVATSAAAERAGVSMDEVEAAGLGNNPVFLRLMASLGAEFREDKGAGKTTYSTFGEEDIRQLEMSEAYSNPRHPDHDKVSQRVKAWYEKKHGTTPVA